MTAFEETHTQLKAQYDELLAKYSALVNMRDDLQVIVGTNHVLAAVRGMKIEYEALRKDSVELRTQLEQARSSLMPLAAEVNKLEAHIVENVKAMRKMVDVETERDMLRSKNTIDNGELNKQLNDLRAQLGVADKTVIDQHAEIGKLRTEVRQLRDTYAPTFAQEFEELKQAVNARDTTIDNLKGELTIATTTVDKLIKQLKFKSNDASYHYDRAERMRNDLNVSYEKRDALENTCKDLRTQRDEARELLQVRSKVCADLIKERDLMRKEINAHIGIRADLVRQIEALAVKYEDLRNATHDDAAKIYELDGNCEALRTIRDERDAQIRDLEAQLIDARKAQDVWRKGAGVAHAKIKELEAQPVNRVAFLHAWAIHQPEFSMENGVDRYHALMEIVKQ